MAIRVSIFSFFLFGLISAKHHVQFIDNHTSLDTNPLCHMGCICPQEGKNLLFLDCSKKNIYRLPSSLHFDLPLSKLDFQRNHITDLNMSIFGKADTIEELDLRMNEIARIGNSTFASFKSLIFLRLWRNYLVEVSPGIFDGLSKLRTLDLGRNTIQRLSPAAFQGTPNLVELRLEYNPIFDLREDLFQFLPNLQRLDLQDTGLVRLPNGIFNPVPHLQWLSLSENAFENVPQEALSHATELLSLDLSGNDITRIDSGNFRRLSNISLLYMNGMPKLTAIEKDAFVGLKRLQALSCSYNPKLSYIDEEAFGSKNSTIMRTEPREQLYLRQNALSTLKSPLTIDSWSHLNYVDLSENPWNCDCKLLWMKQLKKEVQKNIACTSPPHLKGRQLSDIPPSELTCTDKWSLITFYVIVASMAAFGLILLGTSVAVCSRTPPALFIRAKKQFSYSKVDPKIEIVDLEWDPSADT